MARILFSLLLVGSANSAAMALQVLPQDRPEAPFWVPNALADVLVEREGILYVGGGFDRVGPYCGPMAVLDPADGRLLSRGFPAIAGEVFDITSDGAGGWFVAGTFEQVGDQRREGVVRVNADGTLHPWNPGLRGTVTTLLRVGTTLYMGGPFDVALGARVRLAAVDVDSGALRPWNPAASAVSPDQFNSSDALYDLALVGDAILIGGYFPEVRLGGALRSHLASVDAVTGAARPCPVVNGAVFEIEQFGMSTLIAGEFTMVNGLGRSRLALIRRRSVLPSKFPALNGGITAAEIAGKTLYIGGDFTSVGGFFRSHLAAIDLVTGQLMPWAPVIEERASTGMWMDELKAVKSTLFVAGGFHLVSGEARRSLAAVDRIDGQVLDWDASLASQPRLTNVRALEYDGRVLAVGGNMTVANSVHRMGLASYDLASAELLPWAPEIPGVQSLAFDGERVFVGGGFNEANGVFRPRLVVVDATSGELDLGFDAGICHNTGNVIRLAFNGQYLFALGCTNPCGQSCRALSVLDPYTGARIPGMEQFFNSRVRDMQLSADGLALYLGGSFDEVQDPVNGFLDRHHLAAIDTITGLFTEWAPEPMREVLDLELHGGRLFVGGAFESFAGQDRRHLAEVDLFTGLPTGWNPLPDDPVEDLVTDGEVVYFIGSFDLVNGQFLPRLAAVDAHTGELVDWVAGQRSDMRSLLLTQRGLIVSGGPEFAKGVVHNLAVFEYPAPLAGAQDPGFAANR